ncbi:MAG TPA: SDR family oxidoreductase [Streptosporangiaceae bacterium]
MTTAGVRDPAADAGPAPAAGAARALLRLAWLYAVSRRLPAALALMLALGALLWSALHWHWSIAGGPAARELITLTVQAGAAAVVAVSSYGPFGEAERATGRWLPYLRLGTALVLFAVAFGALTAGAAAGTLPGGTGGQLRDLAGFTGLGLLSAAALGGTFGWTGPMAYLIVTEVALTGHPATPWVWAARPPSDRGAALCTAAVFAAGLAAVTMFGGRETGRRSLYAGLGFLAGLLPVGVVSQMAEPDRWFAGKLAVVTGGGSGMGRELACQLAAAGCSVATCDWHADEVAETAVRAQANAAAEVLVTGHGGDVSDEEQVLRFRDELLAQHGRDHVDLVFANAGIGGGSSFVNDSREDWERVFANDWWSVYYCARAFLPLLIASGDGVLVNTSSVNGLWASLGPGMTNSAYATAKFAVRGFTESLIEDLRTHAPQVRVALVLPGHVGTDIVANSLRARGLPGPGQMTGAQLAELLPPGARAGLAKAGLLPENPSLEELRQTMARMVNDFRDKAPLTPARAATIILDGIRAGAWRILVGRDAAMIDAAVRAKPDAAYDYAELFSQEGSA